MRTTVDIPDSIYRQLKIRAARDGRTVKALLLEGATQVLSKEQAPARMKKLKLPLLQTKGGHVITNEMVDEALADFP